MSETNEELQAQDQPDETAGAILSQDQLDEIAGASAGGSAEDVGDEAVQGQQDSEEKREEEESSWEDAMDDLEKQKQMIKESQENVASFETSKKSDELKPSESNDGVNLQTPNLRFILDIPLQMTVELGRKRLLIQDLLQLNQGSILELTKEVGEPFEVLVNQKLVARGEVVVVNDKFGVRITDIISPTERVQQLQ